LRPKRQLNLDLVRSGLLEAKAALSDSSRRPTDAARGIKQSAADGTTRPRRKSGRLAGEAVPALYMKSESGGGGFGAAQHDAEREREVEVLAQPM